MLLCTPLLQCVLIWFTITFLSALTSLAILHLPLSLTMHFCPRNYCSLDSSYFSHHSLQTRETVAWEGGLTISEAADLLGFSCATVSGVCREWCEKQFSWKNIRNLQKANYPLTLGPSAAYRDIHKAIICEQKEPKHRRRETSHELHCQQTA